MTIAEKLILIAENQQKIYDAGYAQGIKDAKPLTFYIEGESHEFTRGMMWGDWCESEYNTIGAFVDNNCITTGGNMFVYNEDWFMVLASEPITPNASYYMG